MKKINFLEFKNCIPNTQINSKAKQVTFGEFVEFISCIFAIKLKIQTYEIYFNKKGI